uniref:Uncharacterized protein n=1 Tax=Oryza sativa subsp. japonica TaxID=39947 RepID=Q9FRJ5_ORYSJ|nr:hypothetical protein [Oryza sativa Japonica Group]
MTCLVANRGGRAGCRSTGAQVCGEEEVAPETGRGGGSGRVEEGGGAVAVAVVVAPNEEANKQPEQARVWQRLLDQSNKLRSQRGGLELRVKVELEQEGPASMSGCKLSSSEAGASSSAELSIAGAQARGRCSSRAWGLSNWGVVASKLS